MKKSLVVFLVFLACMCVALSGNAQQSQRRMSPSMAHGSYNAHANVAQPRGNFSVQPRVQQQSAPRQFSGMQQPMSRPFSGAQANRPAIQNRQHVQQFSADRNRHLVGDQWHGERFYNSRWWLGYYSPLGIWYPIRPVVIVPNLASASPENIDASSNADVEKRLAKYCTGGGIFHRGHSPEECAQMRQALTGISAQSTSSTQQPDQAAASYQPAPQTTPVQTAQPTANSVKVVNQTGYDLMTTVPHYNGSQKMDGLPCLVQPNSQAWCEYSSNSPEMDIYIPTMDEGVHVKYKYVAQPIHGQVVVTQAQLEQYAQKITNE